MKRGERPPDVWIAQAGEPRAVTGGQSFEVAPHGVHEHELAEPVQDPGAPEARVLGFRERGLEVGAQRTADVIAQPEHPR